VVWSCAGKTPSGAASGSLVRDTATYAITALPLLYPDSPSPNGFLDRSLPVISATGAGRANQ
jgi:hypothetical protein